MPTVLIVLSVALLMMLAERLWPGRRFRQSHGWWGRAVSLNLVQAASAFLTALTWDSWLPPLAWLNGSSMTLPFQVMAGYVLITFVYYWWHRARHEVPLLWRWFHQVHHSAGRIEIITSFYKHPLEIFFNAFLSASVLHVLLGLSAEAVAWTVLLTGVAELFYHWNVRTPYWLGFFFQRPESHCVHHREGYHRNNYSDLPLWDMLFGTFENPRTQPERCGFSHDRELQLGRMLAGRDVNDKCLRVRKEVLP
jgi:sterol desaturase/sphingolipid hydroxylase (fatty acid hydroxylase superfamily)